MDLRSNERVSPPPPSPSGFLSLAPTRAGRAQGFWAVCLLGAEAEAQAALGRKVTSGSECSFSARCPSSPRTGGDGCWSRGLEVSDPLSFQPPLRPPRPCRSLGSLLLCLPPPGFAPPSICAGVSCPQRPRPRGCSDLGKLQEGHSPVAVFIGLLHRAVGNALQLLLSHLDPDHQPEYLRGGGGDGRKEEAQGPGASSPDLASITPKAIPSFTTHPSPVFEPILITCR